MISRWCFHLHKGEKFLGINFLILNHAAFSYLVLSDVKQGVDSLLKLVFKIGLQVCLGPIQAIYTVALIFKHSGRPKN